MAARLLILATAPFVFFALCIAGTIPVGFVLLVLPAESHPLATTVGQWIGVAVAAIVTILFVRSAWRQLHRPA
jgi:hypothetical protein